LIARAANHLSHKVSKAIFGPEGGDIERTLEKRPKS
jgi:hypothetical protein